MARALSASSGGEKCCDATISKRLYTIRSALADELLFGKLANGGKVTVDVKDGKVVLEFEEEAASVGWVEHSDTHRSLTVKSVGYRYAQPNLRPNVIIN